MAAMPFSFVFFCCFFTLFLDELSDVIISLGLMAMK